MLCYFAPNLMVDHDFHICFFISSLSLSPSPPRRFTIKILRFLHVQFIFPMKIYPNHHLPQQNSHISRPKSRVPGVPRPLFRASQARAKLGHGDQLKGTHVEGTAVDLAGPDPGTGEVSPPKLWWISMISIRGFQYGDI